MGWKPSLKNIGKILTPGNDPITQKILPAAAPQAKPAPIQAGDPTTYPTTVANGSKSATGTNSELSKHTGQVDQSTQDYKQGIGQLGQEDYGGARQSFASGAADGPSPGGHINPGDKTDAGGADGGSPWVNMPLTDAPTRGAYEDQRNADGTIKTPLSAAAKYTPYKSTDAAAAQAAAFNATGAPASTAYTATGGPATAASVAAAGKASGALTDRATQVGPSAWLNLQLQNQDLAKSNALGNAVSAQGGQNAAARSSLATKGGLSSGAAERIAKTGNQDLTLQKQTILNQDQQARLGLGSTDENVKTGLLGNAANLEQGLSQFNAGQTQQNAQYNLGQGNQLAQFNAGQNQQNSQYNTGQGNALAQFNATANNQNAQYNASNNQQNNQFNANAANTAGQYNAGQMAGANQFDIANALNEGSAKRQDDLAYYQEQMKDRAAGINANAIGAAGSNAGKKLGG